MVRAYTDLSRNFPFPAQKKYNTRQIEVIMAIIKLFPSHISHDMNFLIITIIGVSSVVEGVHSQTRTTSGLFT